jgi:hypothetical protein
MIRYLQNRKRVKLVNKIIDLWYGSSMKSIKVEDLFEPRPKLGTVCFFIGSIDSLCQSLKLEDSLFAKISLNFFSDKDFYKFNQIAPALLKNYFGNNQRVEFATYAMKLGAMSFLDWYNSSFLSIEAVDKLAKLIKEWNRKPNLEGDEIYLFIGRVKG